MKITEDHVAGTILAAATLVLVGARLGLSARVGPLADEALYAWWSERLAWGYLDQPPLVVGLAGLGPAARALPPVLALVAWAALAPSAGSRSRWSTSCLSLPPLILAGTFVVPEAPLVAGWALALAAAQHDRWWLAGLAWSVALWSKHTGLLLGPLLWWGAPPEARRRAAQGLSLGLLLWTPNLAWNLVHDGGSLHFQLQQGLGSVDRPGLWGPIRQLGEQALLGGPLGALFLLYLVRRPPAQREERLAWMVAAPVFAWFGAAGLMAPGDAHWPTVGWIGAAWLGARAAGRWGRAMEVAAWLSLAWGGLFVAHAFHPVLPLRQDPADELVEGEALARSVGRWTLPLGVAAQGPGAGTGAPTLTERYQEAAWIRTLVGTPAWPLPGCGRPDESDRWGLASPAEAYYLRPARSGPPPDCLTSRFEVRARHLLQEPNPRGGTFRWDLFEVEVKSP